MTDQVVFMLQLVITGVAVGGVYSLMALGFVLIFKASTVVNFGPGELVLFGAYVSWATILHMKLPLYDRAAADARGGDPPRPRHRARRAAPAHRRADHLGDHGHVRVRQRDPGRAQHDVGQRHAPVPGAVFLSEPFQLGPVPISPVHLWSFVIGRCSCSRAFSLFFKFSLTGHGHAGHGGQPAGGAVARA